VSGEQLEFFPDRVAFIDVGLVACGDPPVVAEGRVPPCWSNLYIALRYEWLPFPRAAEASV
jgi:hypothetical protein